MTTDVEGQVSEPAEWRAQVSMPMERIAIVGCGPAASPSRPRSSSAPGQVAVRWYHTSDAVMVARCGLTDSAAGGALDAD